MLTLTSTGRLGFVDYPENNEGVGFSFKNEGNLMFEGAFMAATGEAKVSDVARSGADDGDHQNEDWTVYTDGDVFITAPGLIGSQEGTAVFSDWQTTPSLHLKVTQRTIVFDQDPDAINWANANHR